MSTKNLPPPLPPSIGFLPAEAEAIVATTVSAAMANDQLLHLTYILDDGHRCSVKLLSNPGPVPRPGQTVLIFISPENQPLRCSTLPWGENEKR